MEDEGETPKVWCQRRHGSRFESSETLAEFLSLTPLLLESCKACNATYANPVVPVSVGFLIAESGGVGYVSFSTVQSFTGLNLNENQLVPIDSRVLSALQGEDEDPPMVHAGFLHLFLYVYSDSDFQYKILAVMEKCKEIIFTGHSFGGALASFVVFKLMPQPYRLPVMCITYGSHLIGNISLSKAIAREKWEGNFINVVSKHDFIPRLLFGPLAHVNAQVNGLPQLFLLSWTMPHFQNLVSHSSINEELQTFHRDVLASLTEAARDESTQNTYWPLGNYLLCSKDGAICLSDIKAIVKMLHLTSLFRIDGDIFLTAVILGWEGCDS